MAKFMFDMRYMQRESTEFTKKFTNIPSENTIRQQFTSLLHDEN